MQKLYELAAAYNGVWQLLNDPEADLQAIEDTLQCIESSIEEKAQSISAFDAALDADESAIQAQIERLQQRKKAIINRRHSIKNYLMAQLEVAGINKVKTPLFTVSIVNNPPAVQIVDDKAIPAKFTTIVPESYIADKKRIAEALKAGEEVPGAMLTQGKRVKIS